VLSTYRELFAIPGARAFSAAAFVMRLPISMIGLGIMLLIVRTGGSYGLAGLVSAAFWLAYSFSLPWQGRLADRHGQAVVLGACAAVEAVSILALVAGAGMHAPTWALLVAAGAIGAAYVPIGSLVRARWSHATQGTRLWHAAHAWESVVDEVVFITGPVLVTVLCVQVAPAAGLLAAAGLGVVGACWLVPLRATEPPRLPADHIRGSPAVRHPVVLLLTLSWVGLGGVIGSVEVAVVAFTAERGQVGWAGAVLAGLAFGSMLAGLTYGMLRFRLPPPRRMVIALATLTVMTGTLGLLPNTAALAAVAFCAGMAVSPSLITGFALVDSVVPAAVRTEAMSWLSTGIGIGISGGATVVGRIIDGYGARAGFAVPLLAGALATVLAVVVALRPVAAVRPEPTRADA